MTMFERLSARWRGASAERDLPSVAAAPPAKPLVPAEYLSLYTYLEHRYASIVVLTFEQMESLLGFALPPIARTDRNWWTGTAGLTGRHTETWTVARRTATPNLPAGNVAFERFP